LVDPNTRTQKRTPVTLKIKFKSETLEQFIERYAVDVSQGGIFIRTKEPLAVGTQMKFEFQLRDASPLIAGEGTVVWTRENDPSRPAIAPGMGVRFDRLGDGSQSILERILAEKAKQAPVRPHVEASKPPLFTDAPTRVAPAPVTEALLGDRSRRNSDSFNDQHTPLPKPMPFHSDADEFPDEAFEEATKVRALDELVAQTAHAGVPTADELSTRRSGPNPRLDATLPDPNPQAHMHAFDHEAPGLPLPPESGTGRVPKLLDTTPSPRSEPVASGLSGDRPSDLNAAKTRLGLEPARATGPAPSLRDQPPSSPPPMREQQRTPPPTFAVPLTPEPSRIPVRKPSIAPIIIGILVGVAAVGAAVWFFVLKDNDDTPHKPDNKVIVDRTGSGSAGSAAPSVNGSNGSGSAAASVNGSNGSGSVVAPAADVVDTVIAATPDKAKVEIIGSDQSGESPFTAKLEKGKPYKARVSAPGYVAQEIAVTGGGEKLTPKLVVKPRTISIATDPAGAQIYVDNQFVNKLTPADIELTKAQSAKPKVRVSLRKPGYHGYDEIVDTAKYVEDDDKMAFKIDQKMTRAPVVVVDHPNSGSGSGSASTGSGSDASTGSDGSAGSATPSPGSGGTPVSSGSGSNGEPEPDWSKRGSGN